MSPERETTSMTISSRKAAGLKMLAVLICGILLPASAAEKLTSEAVLAKHLASMGTAEARAAVANRIAKGTVAVAIRRGGQGVPTGDGSLVSKRQTVRLEMSFPALDYPGEMLAFDGERVNVGQIAPGQRSRLEAFVLTHGAIVSEGLLGGTISTAWPLLDLAKRGAKLEYGGFKKQDGKDLHELRYKPKKSGVDVQISLYLDPETFRHVRTRYKYVISSSLGPNMNSSSQQQDRTYLLQEDFDDFAAVDGLTLPRRYKITLDIQEQKFSFLADWTWAISQILHNQ
jgi:hypothetical protein